MDRDKCLFILFVDCFLTLSLISQGMMNRKFTYCTGPVLKSAWSLLNSVLLRLLSPNEMPS